MSNPFQTSLAVLTSIAAFAIATPSLAQQDDVQVTADPKATAPTPTPAPAPAPAPASAPDDLRALRDEVRALKDREDARDRDTHPFLEIWDNTKSSSSPWEIPGREGLWLTGYVQGQYEQHQDSQDQLAPGGALVNQDRFVLRRARLKFVGEWTWVATQIELNGDTTKGFNLNLHHAEATLHYRPDPTKVPIAQATVGLFDTPFGYELVESPRSRPFMERTQASRAFWPGEPDLGVRLSGGIEFFRWTAGILNGHPLNDKSYPGQDPVSAKDVLVRVGVDTHPREDLDFSGSLSALKGKGVHAGTDATKGSIGWNDQNEDGVVQPYEVQGIPPASPTPSATFDHWAVGLDLQTTYRAPFLRALGATKLYGEIVLAQNLDRGMFIADPILTTIDTRELGYYVALTQEVTQHGIVGLRYDSYDPNSDILDKRGGKLLPYSNTIRTVSPMVGLVLPHRARLVFQYDVIRNSLGRDAVGVPANLKMNTWTLRMQVEL